MSTINIIKEKYQNKDITAEQALEHILPIYEFGRKFILKLIKEETEMNQQLLKNLKLYKEKELNNEYNNTLILFSQSKINLWNLKDILCRFGEDIE